MPGVVKQKRLTRRLRQQRRQQDIKREMLRRRQGELGKRPPWMDLPPDDDGGAGVREPRRPLPTNPAGAIELDLPR
jgi:hypothetical protein